MTDRRTHGSVAGHDARSSAPTATSPSSWSGSPRRRRWRPRRWMGRGDKNGADGAAVDAMRIVLDTRADGRHRRHRRGREGRGADALQRRAHRRRHADRSPTSPSTRSTAPRSPRSGRGNAIVGHRRVRAGHDVRPGPVRLHGEDRRRPRGRRRRSTSPRRPPRTSQAVAKAKGESVRDVTAVDPRPRPPRRRSSPRSGRPGARIRLIPDGDVAGAISTAWPDSGADILLRHRRHARGRHRRRRAQVHGRRAAGPAVAAQRRRARTPPSTPATTSTRCSPPTTSWPATTASSPPPASPTASCSRASTTTAGGATTQSLVMRSKSGTVRQVNARHQLVKLPRLRRHRLRLTALSAVPT